MTGGARMSVTLDTTRYTDRKQHDCGCITVWDTYGGGSRYQKACAAHRGHAHHFPADNRTN
jgi:hypothetical protein